MSDKSQRVIAIPGLGADRRMFEPLTTQGLELEPVDWLLPEPSESVKLYASRMITHFNLTGDEILLGVSFGGLIAQEIAAQVHPKVTILISSLTQAKQVNGWLRLLNRSFIRGVTLKLPRKPGLGAIAWFNGVRGERSKTLIREMTLGADIRLLKWSLEQLENWKAPERVGNQFHIHGSADRMIPIRNLSPSHIIKDGTHFMVVDQPDEIAILIKTILRTSRQ